MKPVKPRKYEVKTAAERANSYAESLANTMIELLKKDLAPWQRPWMDGYVMPLPMKAADRGFYRGSNLFNLSAYLANFKFEDPRFYPAGFVISKGWKIKKDSKASYVKSPALFKQSETKAEGSKSDAIDSDIESNQGKGYFTPPKYHAVFHASQLEGPQPWVGRPLKLSDSFTRIELVEEVLKGIEKTGLTVSHDVVGGAYYRRSTDSVHMPPPENFKSSAHYYATLLHELGHATGHTSRLKRFEDLPDYEKGRDTKSYAKEELRVEMFSFLASQRFGFLHDPERHADYIKSYLEVLENDPNEIVLASQDACKIMDYVCTLCPEVAAKLDAERESLIFEIFDEVESNISNDNHQTVSLDKVAAYPVVSLDVAPTVQENLTKPLVEAPGLTPKMVITYDFDGIDFFDSVPSPDEPIFGIPISKEFYSIEGQSSGNLENAENQNKAESKVLSVLHEATAPDAEAAKSLIQSSGHEQIKNGPVTNHVEKIKKQTQAMFDF